jgi:hypothetical protein
LNPLRPEEGIMGMSRKFEKFLEYVGNLGLSAMLYGDVCASGCDCDAVYVGNWECGVSPGGHVVSGDVM